MYVILFYINKNIQPNVIQNKEKQKISTPERPKTAPSAISTWKIIPTINRLSKMAGNHLSVDRAVDQLPQLYTYTHINIHALMHTLCLYALYHAQCKEST